MGAKSLFKRHSFCPRWKLSTVFTFKRQCQAMYTKKRRREPLSSPFPRKSGRPMGFRDIFPHELYAESPSPQPSPQKSRGEGADDSDKCEMIRFRLMELAARFSC